MPMRKHEMVYVFYEKLPLYDLSSHKHKFLKDGTKTKDNSCYGVQKLDVKKQYKPPLPVSVVKEPEPEPEATMGDCYGNTKRDLSMYEACGKKGRSQVLYDPPLPNTLLEIKSTRGKHSTEKPVALMEWLLKYYSREGDVVLDPTMGSGSTGVACKNMNRNFIGIELDPEIYEVAVNRIED